MSRSQKIREILRVLPELKPKETSKLLKIPYSHSYRNTFYYAKKTLDNETSNYNPSRIYDYLKIKPNANNKELYCLCDAKTENQKSYIRKVKSKFLVNESFIESIEDLYVNPVKNEDIDKKKIRPQIIEELKKIKEKPEKKEEKKKCLQCGISHNREGAFCFTHEEREEITPNVICKKCRKMFIGGLGDVLCIDCFKESYYSQSKSPPKA